MQQRRLDTLTLLERGYPRTGIVQPMGGDRPTVVGARANDVDLITTPGPVFMSNQPALFAVVGQPLHIAMTIAVDFTLVGVVPCKRVVVRHAAIRVKAHNTANVVLTALGLLAVVETVSEG